MQTRLYSDLFGLIQAMLGINFSVIETIRVKALINRRAQRAYRASNYWTRFLKVAEQRDVINSVISYNQLQSPTIDTFLRIYPYPQDGRYNSQELEFTVASNGASLILDGVSSGIAFVTYKAAIPTYYGDNAGEESAVPYEWFQYIAHGVYADYLRAEGQQDRAAIAEQEANEILTDELIRLDEQHTQTMVSTRIFTTSNMTSRSGFASAVGRSLATTSYTPPSPVPPLTGTYVLANIDGESQWIGTENC